jgi:hypothetical protein
VYESKLEGLKAKGEPILMRYNESLSRDAAVQALSNACQHGMQWVGTTDPKYAHIGAEDRETVQRECASTLSWLESKQSAQAALAPHDDPAVMTSELAQRKQTLENVIGPVINKPAPPPPKPAEPEKKEDDKDPAPMEEDTPQTQEGASAAPMEEP